MPRLIAFLRGINAGPGRIVKMDTLRNIFESLGYSSVESFIASGNIVFRSPSKDMKAIEMKAEIALFETLGFEVAVFLRTDRELAEIAAYNPFSQSQIDTAAEYNIILLSKALDEQAEEQVMDLQSDIDTYHVRGREVYWLRRIKPGMTDLIAPALWKVIGNSCTIRSINTIHRLAEKLGLSK